MNEASTHTPKLISPSDARRTVPVLPSCFLQNQSDDAGMEQTNIQLATIGQSW